MLLQTQTNTEAKNLLELLSDLSGSANAYTRSTRYLGIYSNVNNKLYMGDRESVGNIERTLWYLNPTIPSNSETYRGQIYDQLQPEVQDFGDFVLNTAVLESNNVSDSFNSVEQHLTEILHYLGRLDHQHNKLAVFSIAQIREDNGYGGLSKRELLKGSVLLERGFVEIDTSRFKKRLCYDHENGTAHLFYHEERGDFFLLGEDVAESAVVKMNLIAYLINEKLRETLNDFQTEMVIASAKHYFEADVMFLRQMEIVIEKYKKPVEPPKVLTEEELIAPILDMNDSFIQNLKNIADRRISEIESNINMQILKIKEFREEQQAKRIETMTLKEEISDELKDMSLALLRHPDVVHFRPLLNDDSIYIEMLVETDLDQYDEDIAELLINRGRHGTMATAILKEIFLERKYAVRTLQQLRLNLKGGGMTNSVTSAFQREIQQYKGHNEVRTLANPHIQNHDCFGTAQENAKTAIYSRNYTSAAMVMVNSVKNVNFADAFVAERFIEKLMETGFKYLYDEEGNATNFKELLKAKHKEIEDENNRHDEGTVITAPETAYTGGE